MVARLLGDDRRFLASRGVLNEVVDKRGVLQGREVLIARRAWQLLKTLYPIM